MKLRFASFSALCAAMLSLACSSCMDTVNTTENAQKAAKPDPIDVKRVVTDQYLENRLAVLRVDKEINDSGLLKVQVTARSERTGFWSWIIQGDKPYKLSYKFVWLDDKGMSVETGSNSVWIERDCLPGDIVRFSGVAPTERCKDFQLMLREMPNP